MRQSIVSVANLFRCVLAMRTKQSLNASVNFTPIYSTVSFKGASSPQAKLTPFNRWRRKKMGKFPAAFLIHNSGNSLRFETFVILDAYVSSITWLLISKQIITQEEEAPLWLWDLYRDLSMSFYRGGSWRFGIMLCF